MSTHLVLIDEHLQLPDTDPEVGLIEFVSNVPTQGPKLPPLLYKSVEEAQPEEETLPFHLCVCVSVCVCVCVCVCMCVCVCVCVYA